MASPESPGSPTQENTSLEVFTITNPAGLRLEVLNLGGIIQSLYVPDAKGNMTDIVLGYDDPSHYFNDNAYFGAIIGRYANRIAGASFLLDGHRHSLTKNDGQNHLHGGVKGFSKIFWDVCAENVAEGPRLNLHYLSKDGEEGYPGNLEVHVCYLLSPDNELIIEYRATTDIATVVNLTQHSYFNLAGSGDILEHHLQIPSNKITSVKPDMIPDGFIFDITDTAFDFCSGKKIGRDILQTGSNMPGYDNTYILSGDPALCSAKVTDPASGRIMEVFTDQPGMQLYTANAMDGSIKGKNGQRYKAFSGFCLETQHFPDSPNHTHFPLTLLKPGNVYLSKTIYKFSNTLT